MLKSNLEVTEYSDLPEVIDYWSVKFSPLVQRVFNFISTSRQKQLFGKSFFTVGGSRNLNLNTFR